MTKTVMATRAGVYGHFRDEGAVFEIATEAHFSPFWMSEISPEEALALQVAARKRAEDQRQGIGTAHVDNAEIEALRAEIAEKNAEIERLTRNAPVASAEKTAADVVKMASDPGVEFMTFKAAARKLLGEVTPSTKAEIIAALEDKVSQG